MSYIVPEGLFDTRSYCDCVNYMNQNGATLQSVKFTDYVFENAVTGSLIFVYGKGKHDIVRKEYLMDKEHSLHLKEKKDNTIIDRIRSKHSNLKDIATIFKGMVVGDRKNSVSESCDGKANKFLLGKSICKWMVNSVLWANYNELKIIGGTKNIDKHNHAPRILIRRTLNSHLLDFYNKTCNITNQQGFPQILMTDLEMLPIVSATNEQQDRIATLVDRLFQLKKEDPNADTSKEEQEIDRLVYKLYGLTFAEVKTVDPDTPITEEEYNKE